MLIKFFKSSFIFQYLALVLLSAGLWIPGFLRPHEIPVGGSIVTPLYNLALPLLTILQPYNPVMAYLILLISGLTLNNILIYHELTPKNNLIPAFIFILLFSSDPGTLSLYPMVLTIPFFTWFLHTLYVANDEPENHLAVFNASLILSVITMIYFPAIVLFFLLWLIQLVFGIFSGRNMIIIFIGFFLPYSYLAFYHFWTDSLAMAGMAYLDFFREVFRIRSGADYLQYSIWAYLLFLLMFPAFFKITGSLNSYGISFRKKMSATNWFLVISLPIIFLTGPVEHNLIVLIPASIILAHYFNMFKKSTWNEIVLLVFLFLIAFHNYLGL